MGRVERPGEVRDVGVRVVRTVERGGCPSLHGSHLPGTLLCTGPFFCKK